MSVVPPSAAARPLSRPPTCAQGGPPRPRAWRRHRVAVLSLSGLVCLGMGLPAAAQEDGPIPADLPLPMPPTPPASSTPRASTSSPVWEGALGVNLSYRPEYQGGDKLVAKATPVLFLRYGRFTITNASGFVTRRSDEVVRGLGADLLRSERWRVNLALRFDAGRSEGTSSDLSGLGDVKPTVRARLNATWRGDGGLRAGFSWSADALGRGGGNFGDVSVGYDKRLGRRTIGSVGASLTMAGDRYMQTYYGISEAQAARSAYPVYTPGAGLRDVTVSASFRSELTPQWVLLGGAGISRLMGPAADSPLTKSRDGWGVNLGLARRF